MKSDDALLAPSDNHDALHDISDIDASIIICASCVDLRCEVETLKHVRDDISAKLVEHSDMSARLEIEIDLLHDMMCAISFGIRFHLILLNIKIFFVVT